MTLLLLRLPTSSVQEPQVGSGEVTDVGEHQGEIPWRQAKPGCEGTCVLIDRSGRNPPAPRARSVIGVVRAAQRESRVEAIEIAARYRVAQDELMTTPSVVRAGPCARSRGVECAAEVRHGEGRHLRGNTNFFVFVIERSFRIAY